MQIIGDADGETLDHKRFKIPGVTVKDVCPKCGTSWEANLGRDYYLAYPVVGKPTNLGGYCDACYHEWPVMVVLRVSLELTATTTPPST